MNILFLQKDISDYNIPLYNYLSSYYNVSVAYTGSYNNSDLIYFNIIKLDSINISGIFFVNSLKDLCDKFEIVFFMADLHFVSFCLLPFIKRRSFKVISWSIGFRASYNTIFDIKRKKKLMDYIYLTILKSSDANVFYTKEPIKFWGNLLNQNKIFIANNTVHVSVDKKYVQDNSRTNLLFIGTLYKEKGIDELLNVFKKILSNDLFTKSIFLDIVGDGPEMQNIKDFIIINDLESNIILHGSVYKDEQLKLLFSKSILCISPRQAGLSVLLSLGYGVPFVTKNDAITGGEKSNIIHGYNGFIYNDEIDLYNIILNSYSNVSKLTQLGIQSHDYYSKNCTINIMADGFINSINYVQNK